jgi:hypothetical protein
VQSLAVPAADAQRMRKFTLIVVDAGILALA